MTNMPDDAELRALHETLHPSDYEHDPRAYAPDTLAYSVTQDLSQREHESAGTDSSVASGSDLQRIVNAPEGVLPSDLVPSPIVGSQHSNYAIMCVVALALLIADIVACTRAAMSTVFTICGKGPQKCHRNCRQ